MKDDCDLIVTTAAKYMKSNIENYGNYLPLLNWSSAIKLVMSYWRANEAWKNAILFLKILLKAQ